MIAALILDGAQRSALCAVRALGRYGLDIYVGESADSSLSGSSHFASGFLQYPSPISSPDKAREAITSFVNEHQIKLLFPMSDITSHLMLSGPRISGVMLPTAPFELYETASDKSRLFTIARKAGLSIPTTKLIVSDTAITALPGNFHFPVVLKPTRSRIYEQNGYTSTAVAIAHNLDEFIAIQGKHSYFTEHPWLLQSFIEGTGQGVFTIYDHGCPRAWFAHERIREKPPTGGVSVLSRSAPLSPRLKETAKTLLDALKWHGPAMVEFRVAADSTPYLMEINARFWGSLQLAVAAGVNFPVLATQIAMGEHPEPIQDYEIGIYNRWLLGDLDNLYLTLKAPLRDFSLAQKMAAFGQFLIPWWPGLHYEVIKWGDMGPFWHELKHYLR